MSPNVSTAALETGGGKVGDSSDIVIGSFALGRVLVGFSKLDRDAVQG